ncbi:MAG: hypothetical protein AAGI38_16240 [Bacteroidota bacterium]
MKRLTLCVLLITSLWGTLPGQAVPYSYNGAVHTPRGRLHALVIFVRYADKDAIPWEKTRWPNKEELPQFAQLATNKLLYPDTISFQIRNKTISDFYYTMSGGKFMLTGECFPVQVPVKFIPETSSNFFSRQSQMNQAAINWIVENYPDFDWGRFDNRKNRPTYVEDNVASSPDRKLDYVVFMHRATGGSTGMAATGNLSIPGTDFKVTDGHTSIKGYSDFRHICEYFLHEFAHNLYDSPHYMGANHADGNRYYLQKGWGMMSGEIFSFNTANAWECWWLGWSNPQTIDRSGTFTLRDFATTLDAIRIPLPGTEDVLWLENHQKKDLWDAKISSKKGGRAGNPEIAPGIYAYVTGKPGARREQPRLKPFNPAYANFFRLLNGQGNFDFVLSGDSLDTGFFIAPSLERKATNPMSGLNDLQSIPFDLNGDGRINVSHSHGNKGRKRAESCEIWVEQLNGRPQRTINIHGDEQDGFSTGAEIGLSGTLPALTYPVYDFAKESLSPIYLNGIRIQIGEMDEAGAYQVIVTLDDWQIRNDTRWAGNMIMGKPAGQTLKLAEKKVLTLDLSGTANRITPHPETQVFVNPTVVRIDSGNTFLLTRKSEVKIAAFAKLVIAEGATLKLDRQSSISIMEGGKLEISRGARVELGRVTKITGEGNLILEEGAEVIKKRRAVIRTTGVNP